jgi:hypothetical protein
MAQHTYLIFISLPTSPYFTHMMYNPIIKNLYLNKNIPMAQACSPLAKLTNHSFKSYLLNP